MMAKAVVHNGSGMSEYISATECMRRKIDAGFDIYAVIEKLHTLFPSCRKDGKEGLDALAGVANLLGVPNEFRKNRKLLLSALGEMMAVVQCKKTIDEKDLYEGKVVSFGGWDCMIEKISRDYRVTLRFFMDGSSLQRNPLGVD